VAATPAKLGGQALPCSDICPSNQPVASPASFSVVSEWVSRTMPTAMATSLDRTRSPASLLAR
jgi:hypothetical protein